MKIVLQRVTSASVTIDGTVSGRIGKGFLLLLGIAETDHQQMAGKIVEKICKLRIFEDENGKTNRSLADVDGEILVVSQFTLYADCKKGNRPSFTKAGSPQKAEQLYKFVIEQLKSRVPCVEQGVFGADMKIELVNDGPFTLVLDSDDLF